MAKPTLKVKNAIICCVFGTVLYVLGNPFYTDIGEMEVGFVGSENIETSKLDANMLDSRSLPSKADHAAESNTMMAPATHTINIQPKIHFI